MTVSPEVAVRYEIAHDVAVLIVDFPPVNALAAPMRDGLVLRLTAAFEDPAIDAIVIIGENDRFIAGADIREFGKPRQGADLLAIQDMMENSPKPIVAAIDGHALGGGLELALAAPFRIATTRAKFGLPEVNLGLLPGGGGTQRTARLIGPEQALDLILTGKHISAPRALDLGLIDEVASGELLLSAIAFVRNKAKTPGPYPKASERSDRVCNIKTELFTETRRKYQERWRGTVAPFQIVDCIEAACRLTPTEGLKFEKKALAACQESPVTVAQVHLFFAERKAAKTGKPAANGQHHVGSASVMGERGLTIAIAAAVAGIAVTLVAPTAHHPVSLLEEALRIYAAAIDEGTMTKSVLAKACASIDLTISPVGIDRSDVIIDARIDNSSRWPVSVEQSKPRPALLGVSFQLPSVGKAGPEKRRGDTVYIRLLAPSSMPTLAEIIAGDSTPEQALEAAIAFVKRVGLAPVVVRGNDASNRMLEAYRRECEKMLREGISFETLDRALSASGLQADYFSWAASPSEAIGKTPPPDIGADEIVARIGGALANEGAALLESGKAQRASDIDILCVIGLGFPRYLGGPMFWAEKRGLAAVRDILLSHQIHPIPLLARLAADNKGWDA